MVSQNKLDVDPGEVAHDLNNDWKLFRESRIRKFFIAWAESKIHGERIALETTTPDKLSYVQGTINGFKALQILLDNPSVVDDLKRTVEYLEKHYG